MHPVQSYAPSDGIAASGLGSWTEVSLPNYASKKRKLGSDEGSDLSEAKRHKVDDQAYIAKLQRWRDSLPFKAVRNELPLGWHTKPMLEVLQACPVLLDLWMKKVARGEWLFERNLRHPHGYFLPQDFKGLPTWAVTEAHPRFEDLITCGVNGGQIITYDPEDMAWFGHWRHAREKAWRWIHGLPPTLSDPYSARTSVPSVVWSSEASTQRNGNDDLADQDSDVDGINLVPNNFLSLSPSQALALVPALHETFDGLDIKRLAFRGNWSMGQLMQDSPELREALADLLLTSRIVFADARLHIMVQGFRIWCRNGTCTLKEAREKVKYCWNRLGLWR
ncbi:hypothetical protein PG984_004291 [Apiospora sp. TS-2023a]